MPRIGTERVEIAAVKAIGIPITGYLRKFGIIILMAPKKIATCTPGLSTFMVAQKRKPPSFAMLFVNTLIIFLLKSKNPLSFSGYFILFKFLLKTSLFLVQYKNLCK
ncbi:hypothetical protein LOB90_03135 [Lactobacillus delbrueckii subsp. lactis]|nr:hypothetical protein [Lactobacillus delbrueckii subsp. lactis]